MAMTKIERAEQELRYQLQLAKNIKEDVKRDEDVLTTAEARELLLEAWRMEDEACEAYQKAIREEMKMEGLR